VYRVTANLTLFVPGSTPIAMSDPIVLDGSRKHTVVEVRFMSGPTLTFHAVDAVTGKPVPRPYVRVTPRVAHLPPNTQFSPAMSDPSLKIENVPPSSYSISASVQASRRTRQSIGSITAR